MRGCFAKFFFKCCFAKAGIINITATPDGINAGTATFNQKNNVAPLFMMLAIQDSTGQWFCKSY